MHLHQFPQLVYAKDGIPLDNPYWADTINVAPGERYSVLFNADTVGTWVYHCHILTHVERADGHVRHGHGHDRQPQTVTTARRAVTISMSTALLTLSACGGSDSSGETEMLPDVELIGVGETTVSTGTWIGEPLVINFWFSTCIPCATELVDFAEVDETRGDEVRFIGVNPIDTPEAMADFAADRGVDLRPLPGRVGRTPRRTAGRAVPRHVLRRVGRHDRRLDGRARRRITRPEDRRTPRLRRRLPGTAT